ncbi:hypothetical protein N9283_04320 [Akkermansiaceae bacterium]|nr:hypothetical protein [Akkermansiaceae bacterium]MDB4547557.1 hypothetical protein [Akkermansiaceae bacterium]
MSRVLSHIVQKRFSQVNEDVATDALAYVLESSPAASNGMRKLLCGLVPDLAALKFKTQEAEGVIRPDMWGYEGTEPRVFIENKFWAGLTDNQPVNYLKQLATYSKPSILLVVAPTPRLHTLWRELQRRVMDAGFSLDCPQDTVGIHSSARTSIGPILAVTSWDNILSALEHETIDDPEARGDLVQLRALCDAADIDAFSPLSREELTDQRTPALVLELNSIWEGVSALGVARGIIDHKRLRPQASSERIGRYTSFAGDADEDDKAGAWFGLHFRLWKKHGMTPLWAVFHSSDFGRADAVQAALESWASKEGVFTSTDTDGSFVIAFDIPAAEEKDSVVEAVLERFEQMHNCWLARSISVPEPIDHE